MADDTSKLAFDASASRSERREANWSLCRWHTYANDFEKSLSHVRLTAEYEGAPKLGTLLAEMNCLVNLGRSEEARDIGMTALETHPDDPSLLFMIAVSDKQSASRTTRGCCWLLCMLASS